MRKASSLFYIDPVVLHSSKNRLFRCHLTSLPPPNFFLTSPLALGMLFLLCLFLFTLCNRRL